jgi:hypothetical protein
MTEEMLLFHQCADHPAGVYGEAELTAHSELRFTEEVARLDLQELSESWLPDDGGLWECDCLLCDL